MPGTGKAAQPRVAGNDEDGHGNETRSIRLQEIPNGGHSLVTDRGWQEVADDALAFIQTNRRERG